MEMELRIRFYGRLADVIAPEVEIAGGSCSVGELRCRITADFPAAQAMLGRARTCIGGRLVSDEQSIGDAETLEFLPPVSGG